MGTSAEDGSRRVEPNAARLTTEPRGAQAPGAALDDCDVPPGDAALVLFAEGQEGIARLDAPEVLRFIVPRRQRQERSAILFAHVFLSQSALYLLMFQLTFKPRSLPDA